jgi:hypothetical protein
VAGNPKVSPQLQSLIDKGLFEQLPPTFSTFFYDRIQEWDLLFPAERSYHERLFAMLDRSDPKLVEGLFAPLRAAERKMRIDKKTWPMRQFTLDQVDFLNRSQYYPEWRRAVADIFARVDPLLDEEIVHAPRPRLVIVTAPAELPVGPDRMWLRLREHGRRVPVDPPPDVRDYLKLMLGGETGPPLTELHAQVAYDVWSVAAGPGPAPPSGGRVCQLSYEALKDYRVRLMTEVQRLVESKTVPGPRQLSERLREMHIRASEGQLASDPILAEFARATLLSGNGTLLINNTFVEWAAIQAVRRARPSLAVISFGIRNKLKPFSSLLIYADQDSASPVPTQMDTLGTYVDLEIFYQYIWQEFEKHAKYRGNTAYLFIAEGMEEMFAIAPDSFPLLRAWAPVKPEQVYTCAREWLKM